MNQKWLKLNVVKSLVLALAILIGGGSSNIWAYDSPSGDPFYEDNYAVDEEYFSIPEPKTKTTEACEISLQLMCYEDWIDSGYYY